MEGFGKRLQQYRKTRHLTQRRLSEMVGVSVNSIASYEVDRREPSMKTLLDIARALDVSLDTLFGFNCFSSHDITAILQQAGYIIAESDVPGNILISTPPIVLDLPVNENKTLQSVEIPPLKINVPINSLRAHVVGMLRLGAAAYARVLLDTLQREHVSLPDGASVIKKTVL